MNQEIRKDNDTGSGPPICAICGKPITSNCTVDHVIPQAIYKWHEKYLSRSEFTALRRRITSPRNTVKAHRRCNERKEESIIEVSALHVNRRKRAKLQTTLTAVEPYIQAFQTHKAELLERQEGRCILCKAPLKDGGVLRRIDNTLDRTWDNACLLCHRCNCKVRSKDVKSCLITRKRPDEAGSRPKSRRNSHRRRHKGTPAPSNPGAGTSA